MPPLFRHKATQMYAHCGLWHWKRKETGFICDVSYIHVVSTFTFNVKTEAVLSSDVAATTVLAHGTNTQEQD